MSEKLVETELDRLFPKKGVRLAEDDNMLDRLLKEEDEMLVRELKRKRAEELLKKKELEVKKLEAELRKLEGNTNDEKEVDATALELAKELTKIPEEERRKVIAYYQMLRSNPKGDVVAPLALMLTMATKPQEGTSPVSAMKEIAEALKAVMPQNVTVKDILDILRSVSSKEPENPVQTVKETLQALKELGFVPEKKEETRVDSKTLLEIERIRDERERWLKEMDMKMEMFKKTLELKEREAERKFQIERMKAMREMERGDLIKEALEAVASGVSEAFEESKPGGGGNYVVENCPVCAKEGIETKVVIPNPEVERVVMCGRGHKLVWRPERHGPEGVGHKGGEGNSPKQAGDTEGG